MAETHYHVIAPAETKDLRVGDLAVVRVQEGFNDGAWSAEPGLVRIERPASSSTDSVRDATPDEVAASIIPVALRQGTHDSEEAALGWNQGYDEAVSQQLQDNPALFAVALRAAADRLAANPAQAKLDLIRAEVATAMLESDGDDPGLSGHRLLDVIDGDVEVGL